MCQDCDRVEKHRQEENHKDWNKLFELACKAEHIKVYCKLLKMYVESKTHTDILESISGMDTSKDECPSYTDDLEASGTLYIG